MSEVANFTIEYTRFLDPMGEPIQALPLFAHHGSDLVWLYKNMLRTRLFDNKAVALQKMGKLNTYASILGQEAVSVGIGASMQKEDVLCPFYRDYAAQLMRGVKMSEILSFWRGNEKGNCFQECPSDFPICVPIATQLLYAAGVATAFKLREKLSGPRRVVVATCGDGATSQGDFYEALNIAGVWQLPIVFVINNNQWAISIPRSYQSHSQTLAQKAIAAGIHGEQVDGNDVVAVRFVLEKAIEKAREKKGPSLIEALTYRLSDHTTSDNAIRYRSAADLDQAWKEEPLLRLRRYLCKKEAWSDPEEENFKKESGLFIEEAVNEYLRLPEPAVTDMFDYHYAHLPRDLSEQRIEAEALFRLEEIASK